MYFQFIFLYSFKYELPFRIMFATLIQIQKLKSNSNVRNLILNAQQNLSMSNIYSDAFH